VSLAPWIALLFAAILIGVALVAAMVLARGPSALAAVLAGGLSAMAAVAGGVIVERYGTPEAVGLALASVAAGIVGGYWVAAASLPLVCHRRATIERLPIPVAGGASALIILDAGDPERYSPSVTVSRTQLYIDTGAVEIPVGATPFVHLSEKARYRSAGGRLTGNTHLRSLALRVGESLAERGSDLRPYAAHTCMQPTLTAAVAQAIREGASRVTIVPLGTADSEFLREPTTALEEACAEHDALDVRWASSIWLDHALAQRLAERICERLPENGMATLGVVLAGPGVPDSWRQLHGRAEEDETYFCQRTRMLLVDAGLDERHVRTAWLDWQTPDVTEAVRHLAAVGCTQITVAIATLVIDNLATTLDLPHAIALARVPESTIVRMLPPWRDDPVLADVIARRGLDAVAGPGR
jgi:protoheme ferro-lyase